MPRPRLKSWWRDETRIVFKGVEQPSPSYVSSSSPRQSASGKKLPSPSGHVETASSASLECGGIRRDQFGTWYRRRWSRRRSRLLPQAEPRRYLSPRDACVRGHRDEASTARISSDKHSPSLRQARTLISAIVGEYDNADQRWRMGCLVGRAAEQERAENEPGRRCSSSPDGYGDNETGSDG